MRPTDKYFGRFIVLSLFTGLAAYLFIAIIWLFIARVSWFGLGGVGIAALMVLCWAIGGILGCLFTPTENINILWFSIYVMTVVTFWLLTIIFGSWGDMCVDAWMLLFMFVFPAVSLPPALLLKFLGKRVINSIKSDEDTVS